MSNRGAVLQPTFQGHVATIQDALILFEACLQSHLSHVWRRPHERERKNLIRSGSIFIYEENESSIKRWTDGFTWSPSRILGNFLVYRELDKPFPPGKKKRATKKQKRRLGRPGQPYRRPARRSFPLKVTHLCTPYILLENSTAICLPTKSCDWLGKFASLFTPCLLELF